MAIADWYARDILVAAEVPGGRVLDDIAVQEAQRQDVSRSVPSGLDLQQRDVRQACARSAGVPRDQHQSRLPRRSRRPVGEDMKTSEGGKQLVALSLIVSDMHRRLKFNRLKVSALARPVSDGCVQPIAGHRQIEGKALGRDGRRCRRIGITRARQASVNREPRFIGFRADATTHSYCLLCAPASAIANYRRLRGMSASVPTRSLLFPPPAGTSPLADDRVGPT